MDSSTIIMPRRSRRLLLRRTPPVLPSAHWISLGFKEDVARGLERLQRDLLESRTTNDGSVRLGRARHLVPSLCPEGYIFLGELPYHESILPHWGAFARNLKDGSQSLTKLNLNGIQMTDVVLETISPALHSVKCLNLADCGLDIDCFRSLTRFLDGNSNLEELVLGGGQYCTVRGFDNLDASSAFARAVKKHPTLRKLSTSHCNIGENPDIAKIIIDGCENLEEVGLVDEFAGDDCAKDLASMIKRNKNLQQILLFWNDFTDQGTDEIMASVFDTSSLNATVDSNHKAVVYLHNDNGCPDEYLCRKMVHVNRSDDEASKKIRYKVQRALFGPLDSLHWDHASNLVLRTDFPAEPWKEMHAQYFNDLPVELAPRVLEFVQENKLVMLHEYDYSRHCIKRSWFEDLFVGRDRALSWVFQAMKSWCVPAFGVVADVTAATGKRKRED